MFKPLAVVLLFLGSALAGYDSIPYFNCDRAYYNSKECVLSNILLSRGVTRFRVDNPYQISNLDTLSFVNSSVPVLSEYFVTNYQSYWSKLENFVASNTSVEVVDQELFASLFQLKHVDLSNNKLQVLPEGLFRNNFQLRSLNLEGNRIFGITDAQFVANTRLKFLGLNHNRLGHFPISSIRNSQELEILDLQSNYLTNFDEDGIVSGSFPLLYEIKLQDNNFICKNAQRIVNKLKQDCSKEMNRARPFLMNLQECLACIPDSWKTLQGALGFSSTASEISVAELEVAVGNALEA